MFIKSIELTNFRNRENYHLDFDDITILIGPNGVGKTNIIEGVWLVATGRSWRTSKDQEMTEWDKDFSRIKLSAQSEDDKVLELFWSASARRLPTRDGQRGDKPVKQLKINGVKHRLIDLLGTMPAVMFSPETIDLLNGAPQLRRRFLDIILSQTDRHYALNLLEYHKVLRERNKLLAHIKNHRSKPDELEFWDAKLIEIGSFIIKKRQDIIKFLNKNLSQDYEKISGKKQELVLRYKASVEIERFTEQLIAMREREVEQSGTLYGPHRDDFLFILDDREAATFASRGEFRSVILALKCAEILYLESVLGEKPVLLLDDIFSELDADRRAHLAKIVEGQQTVITTTDLDHIEKELRGKAKIVKLE